MRPKPTQFLAYAMLSSTIHDPLAHVGSRPSPSFIHGRKVIQWHDNGLFYRLEPRSSYWHLTFADKKAFYLDSIRLNAHILRVQQLNQKLASLAALATNMLTNDMRDINAQIEIAKLEREYMLSKSPCTSIQYKTFTNTSHLIEAFPVLESANALKAMMAAPVSAPAPFLVFD